ncbi:leucine-rich repeat domain-containing protein, partial [bacterium]|nr:leucine-rich repeat domain-containing protein [bacterium]
MRRQIKILISFMIFILVQGLVISSAIGQEVVKFADPNLEKVVRNTLKIPDNQAITMAKLRELKILRASSKNIKSLSGIEYAINLQVLYLDKNKITDIKPLAKLTNLQELSLGANEITDISPLANLTSLRKLNLGSNQIENISALSNLTNLQE